MSGSAERLSCVGEPGFIVPASGFSDPPTFSNFLFSSSSSRLRLTSRPDSVEPVDPAGDPGDPDKPGLRLLRRNKGLSTILVGGGLTSNRDLGLLSARDLMRSRGLDWSCVAGWKGWSGLGWTWVGLKLERSQERLTSGSLRSRSSDSRCCWRTSSAKRLKQNLSI